MTFPEIFDQAMAHHQGSRLDLAERLYRQILSADPRHVDALHMMGVLSGQRGKVDEAIDLIQQAIRLRPRSYEQYSNLAFFLAQRGRTEEMVTAYAQGAAVAPQSVEAQYNYATALHSLKRHEEAAVEYRKVLALKPDHAEALEALAHGLLALGRLEESTAAYREVYRLQPTSPAAANNLGNILRGMGRVDESIGLFRRAIWLRPTLSSAHYNLGHALQVQGDLDRAILSYRAAVTYDGDFAEGWYDLGLAFFRRGQYGQAVAVLQRAAELRPDHAETHHVLGNAYYKSGDPARAAEAYRKAVKLRPDFSESYNNLGNVLQGMGKIEEAIEAYGHVLRVRPDVPEGHFNLGNALQSVRRYDEAIVAYRSAVKLRPNYAEGWNNLGNALRLRGIYSHASGGSGDSSARSGLEEAAAAFERALAINPIYAEAHLNIGNLLKDAGRIDEAIASYRKAHAILPTPTTAGNLLYALHFHPDYGPRELFDEHRQWNQQFIAPLAPSRQAHSNDTTPGRRLRIGYVSPDFREHPVGRFMLSLLANHDHKRFEVYCYSDVGRETPMTLRLKKLADVWRDTTNLSDEQLAQWVREDRIDVLVDLAMHMQGSRLLMFGRKPAPVQVTYLAYCGTTGSETIDYFFTDPYMAPLESEREFYSEKPVELRSYWCDLPPEDAPAVGPLPVLGAGKVTFGSLNNFSKVSAPAIEAWAEILRSVPESRLILHTHDGSHRASVLEKFGARGIESGRVELVGYQPWRAYLQTFNRIDIALDPFPYPGGTTSFDAMWMGAPVVTLAGKTAVSRGGAGILSHLGLKELVAKDVAEYMRIAVGLAGDLPKLAGLRAGLRERLRNSVMMDATGFARDVEAKYQQMWEVWRQSAHIAVSEVDSSVSAEEWNARGIALERQGRSGEAVAAYRRALERRPDWPEATFHLANALYGQQRLEESIEMFRKVTALAPHFPEPFNNMGIALSELGRRDEALEAFREAVRLNPGYADGQASLGIALRDVDRPEEAAEASRKALELRPGTTSALINLGNIAMAGGSIDEGLRYFQQAAAVDTTPASYHNYLFSLNFSPKLTTRQIATEHDKWEREYVIPRVRRFESYANVRDPEKPLRVGYVSPDFREHGVGRFLVPLFANHDRRQVEVYCYASIGGADAITRRLRSFAHTWRDVLRMTDAQLAQVIHADQVDVLVDLSMHSGGSRLMALAQKPAPVQVTYLGYAGTTGLHAIDYRLSDIYLDPPGDDGDFVEKPVRLRSHWCYEPLEKVPAVGPAPAVSNRFITFGCLNNFAKVNEGVLNLWRRILRAVPRSRLVLHACEGAHRERTGDFFEAGGVTGDRIEFAGFVPAEKYLQQYNRIDIALDPFPYAGATTTCDALYLGVPVITVGGKSPLSRAGVSVLSNAGLPELIARDEGDYLEKAVKLAGDVKGLAELRGSLRRRMEGSRLMNGAEFARDVERAYRGCWRDWCTSCGFTEI